MTLPNGFGCAAGGGEGPARALEEGRAEAARHAVGDGTDARQARPVRDNGWPRLARYPTIALTTFPFTSVSRMSRPAYRYVSFS